MADSKLYLYETDECQRFDQATLEGKDVVFPATVNGWTDVMDCRCEPYDEKSLEENCDIASHVRKKYILVSEDQVSSENPTS
ncbi:MAG: hypothetical protein ACQEVA_01935 [Myxococcota bacterium]